MLRNLCKHEGTKSTPKPHIWIENQRWYCGADTRVFGQIVVRGKTPKQAYNAYQQLIVTYWNNLFCFR